MSANHDRPTGNQALADALLAFDSRMPSSSAAAREIAQEALRRDRRRVRILTGVTICFFLFAVVAICLPACFCYMKILPALSKCEQDLHSLAQELDRRELQRVQPDLLDMTARITVGLGGTLFPLHVIDLFSISALSAVMLAAIFCTVLLVMASRRATLRQIQVSLLILSEQLDALQQSRQGSHSADSRPAMPQPGEQ